MGDFFGWVDYDLFGVVKEIWFIVELCCLFYWGDGLLVGVDGGWGDW